ncbi:MAG TPA: HAMP domain-containing sensor histidine kinase [Solirubrobacteraceae bacterium]|nr:HAMP domain-containing sensor histidine kinase [Solirubrobacteraceae bacterium]
MALRSGAFGLRARIVGAVLLTTVATLVVAAVALLGPLEQKLRAAEYKAFKDGLNRQATTQPFTQQPLASYLPLVAERLYLQKPTPVPKKASRSDQAQIEAANSEIATAQSARTTILSIELQLVSRIGASEVALLTRDPSTGRIALIARIPADADTPAANDFSDAPRAFGQRKLAAVYRTQTIGGTEYAQATLPFAVGTRGTVTRWMLVVRKPFAEVYDAVRAVRTAFFDGAVAGLVLTLLLAIPLALRIVRRLRRLRQAALQVAETGPHVDFRVDRARDEVGDLARAFALMQSQLKRQEEARRAFVATASHELRTPLTSLEGMLELLEDDLASPRPDIEDARELVERARAQSHRLGRLAADLLDLSRIDAQVQLRSEPIELRELSRAVIAEFELGTHERGINAELHDEGTPVWALGDPGSVARILRILLDNAVRVSPPGAEITVELQVGEQAGLTVCDQGPGVPPEERELIFERFQRGRNTSGQAGFGLGLAIGRELAERMGGQLVLDDAPCPGARFTLRLPVATAPEHDTLAVV